MSGTIFFFLGTEAELIKIFPVIMETRRRGLEYKIIASGQNDITKSRIFKSIDCGAVDLELSYESDIRKSAAGLLSWWIKTYRGALKKIRAAFPQVDFGNSQMVVHGDTVSTFMGAQLGRRLGMRVCHVEAGLRSHHLFNPFPEEIDRLLTSRRARLHFAPGSMAAENLKNAKGTVIDTRQNTLLDSLRYSQQIPVESDIADILDMDYFVFVMHRQENLTSKEFVSGVVKEIVAAAADRKCVVILHKITENTFIKFGLMDELRRNPQIILHARVDYFDFMKLLQNAAFVITDGGSNQEELFYMNKPCLILRTTTERNEGLGINARLFNGDASDIRRFVGETRVEKAERKVIDGEPSRIIVDALERR